jgi:hypothetical protein
MEAHHGAPGPFLAGKFLRAQVTAQMVIGGFPDGYSDAYAEANADTLAAVMHIMWVNRLTSFLFLSV